VKPCFSLSLASLSATSDSSSTSKEAGVSKDTSASDFTTLLVACISSGDVLLMSARFFDAL